MELNFYFDDFQATPFYEQIKLCQYPWEILKVIPNLIFEKNNQEIFGTFISGDVFIGENVKIYPTAVIEGPTYIGNGTIVRPHAWIRPNSIIGENCVIGKGSEIKNVFIFNNSKIGSNCFVGDSVLGKGARVGSNVVLSNRRFDQKEIIVEFNNKKVSTEMDKFSAVIGEYSRIGAGCVTSPGTLICKHSWITSGLSIYGTIPSDKLVMGKTNLEFKDKERVELEPTDFKGNI